MDGHRETAEFYKAMWEDESKPIIVETVSPTASRRRKTTYPEAAKLWESTVRQKAKVRTEGSKPMDVWATPQVSVRATGEPIDNINKKCLQVLFLVIVGVVWLITSSEISTPEVTSKAGSTTIIEEQSHAPKSPSEPHFSGKSKNGGVYTASRAQRSH